MLYRRDILEQLENELTTKEIIVMTGMRQVGKTTLLNHLFEKISSDNKLLLDLENPLYCKLFETGNYDEVWDNLARLGLSRREKAYLFLDEIQNLPEISRVVKYLYDHGSIKFFLIGSSSYYLKNLFPESLAGRKLVFEIFPLTFREFLRFKGRKEREESSFKDAASNKNAINFEILKTDYQEFTQFGGFPGVVLEESKQRKKMLLGEIFTSYFEKDAKSLSDFREMSKLRDLILLLVPRIGSKLEINKLAVELAVSRVTVYEYLAFLEQTYFISLLPKFSGSMDRQAAGSKKLYVCDSGIANVLGQISDGQSFEQSVFQNLRPKHELSYLETKAGGEVDFVVDKKTALEVKRTASPREIENLRRRVAGVKKIAEYFVVASEFNQSRKVIMAADL